MVETSQTIAVWGDETFGNVKDLSALTDRIRLELEELEEAVKDNDKTEIGKEAADVAILLHRLLGCLGQDLNQEVDQKMALNRARKWQSAGDGTGSHTQKAQDE